MALGGAFWRFWCATVLANIGDGIRAAAFPLLSAALGTVAVATWWCPREEGGAMFRGTRARTPAPPPAPA